MASGIVRKAMVYLGLTDDEYEEYDPYEDAAAVGAQPPPRRAADQSDPGLGPVSVRPVARGDFDPSNGGVTVTSRPAVVRPVPTVQSTKVQVVAPHRFADAQEIGDRFKSGQPVIVNLQNNERELARRMIDFCSGVTYALGGSMDKVAEQVFLLTPSNVEVSAEEKRRLEERGYSS
jgi:cell division inhibitor SepF